MKAKTKLVLNVTVSKNGFPPTKAVLLYYLIREANIQAVGCCSWTQLKRNESHIFVKWCLVIPTLKYSLIIFQDATIFVIFTYTPELY